MPPLFARVRSFLRDFWPQTLLGKLYLWTSLIGIPFYGYVYWGPAYLHTWRVFGGATALFLFLGAQCMVGASYLTSLTIRRYPEPRQAAKRVGLNLTLLVFFILVGTRFTMWWMDAVHLFGYTYRLPKDYWVLASVGSIYMLITGLAEAVYVLSQWRQSQFEAQYLEKQQVQNELEDVKQQVNPHFLFNCLNSLSVLIGEAPQQAELFVDEMATVYRYLLQAHRTSQLPAADEVGLVPLEAELAFLHSYGYLLRTRYGAGLELCLPAGAPSGAGSLLPLTLQTLVDNAIRHNIASEEAPLRIEIQTLSRHCLRVRNTLQKRSVRIPMAQHGLGTLQARYRLLGAAEAIRVEANEHCFSVLVQLL